MKKNFFALVISLLFCQFSQAQIEFEQGYFINNQGDKTSCLIKNLDWNNNPTKIAYKLSANGIIKTIDIDSMKEFAIESVSKYVRFTLDIDLSSNNLDNLSPQRNPDFKKETLLLKVLVHGSATLYTYTQNSLTRYFYSINRQDPIQLVYKKFSIPDSYQVRENNQFRNQLWDDLKCKSISKISLERLEYKRNQIIKVFEKYNSCGNEEFKSYAQKSKQGNFHITLRPGVGSSSFKVQNSLFTTRNIDFSGVSYRFGVEFEYVFPFAKNKWSVLVEPTYRSFSASETLTGFEPEVDYSSLEIQSGIRHYLFLNDDSKLFINGLFVFDLSAESSELRYRNTESYELDGSYNFAFGIGYKFKDTFGVELRYQANRTLIWKSDYSSTSVVIGYSLF